MGDFALGHYPTHGLVGLFTREYWQEPWNIPRWMTAILRSGHRRVFVAYFPYRLGPKLASVFGLIPSRSYYRCHLKADLRNTEIFAT
jgi:hypothetical protein